MEACFRGEVLQLQEGLQRLTQSQPELCALHAHAIQHGDFDPRHFHYSCFRLHSMTARYQWDASAIAVSCEWELSTIVSARPCCCSVIPCRPADDAKADGAGAVAELVKHASCQEENEWVVHCREFGASMNGFARLKFPPCCITWSRPSTHGDRYGKSSGYRNPTGCWFNNVAPVCYCFWGRNVSDSRNLS